MSLIDMSANDILSRHAVSALVPAPMDLLGVNATASASEEAIPPLFVLCTARSGSTLLRLMLDSHPDLACPAETNLSDVFSAIARATTVVIEGHCDADEIVAALCRHVADTLMATQMRAAEKVAWADKSLSSVEHAELLLKVYPQARFICLYRDCADTVASLHEVCAWGYGPFGVESYVRQHPNNLPLALASYWADRVSLERAFEDEHPQSCCRLRYEDLVNEPEASLSSIFAFARLNNHEEAIRAAASFARTRASSMPGDIKARFTVGVGTTSVGRGWSVPTEMIPPELRERIDALSLELGYSPIRDLKDSAESLSRLASGPSGHSPNTASVADLLTTRVAQRLKSRTHRGELAMKLVLTDQLDPWLIDFENASIKCGDAPAEWVAVTDSSTLLSIASGRCNAGTALRESTLRVASPRPERPEVFLDCVDALIELLRD